MRPFFYIYIKVGKLSLYKIPLRGLSEGSHTFDYKIDGQFFKLIADEDSDVHRGLVDVVVEVKRKGNLFEVNFTLKGEVFVPCDRCLDDMQIEIDTVNRLIVKFGKEYSEESDEIVVIPEEDGEINIAWFLYEFIALNVPMKHVHPAGKCNKMMSGKLNKHRATSSDSDDDESDDEDIIEDDGQDDDDQHSVSDSRWDALKDVSFDD